MGVDDKVRVLLVDDDAETRENVRKLLQFEADVEVVGAARSGQEGVQLTQELGPDVVLMDINMPDMDGILATESIRKKAPSAQVVILSVQGEQSYMRQAMLAGARDFLTKPPTGNELISAIRRAGNMARQERAKNAQISVTGLTGKLPPLPGMAVSQGKIISVYSPKGGTGCTTVAVNLALALNNEETPVVVVDGNLQYGDVAVFVNEQGKNSIADLAPRVDDLDPEIVTEVMIKHPSSGLHVLASPSRPEQAEKITADQFAKVLSYLRQLYAYIVVDTVPILTDITLSTVDASDLIVLVTTQDIPSIKNAHLFLDLLQNLGIGRERVVFVMNRFDKRVAITPERVGENLRQPIIAVIPLDERAVIPAVNRGIPFVLETKTQPAARGIFALAEVVRTNLANLESEEVNS
jgi:pilus assembly protein CpaE